MVALVVMASQDRQLASTPPAFVCHHEFVHPVHAARSACDGPLPTHLPRELPRPPLTSQNTASLVRRSYTGNMPEPTKSDSQLSHAQHDAVVHNSGPLIVLAGPGTGKTRVIIHRIAHQIESRIAKPEEIVAVTFTVKATQQLRERLSALIGGSLADRVNIHTFHGLGNRILRRFPDLVGLPGDVSLVDEAQQRRALRELILKDNLFPESAGLGVNALLDNATEALAAFANLAADTTTLNRTADAWHQRIQTGEMDADERAAQAALLQDFRGLARLSGLYDELRRKRGWLTVDDLVVRTIRLIDTHPRVAAILRSEWRHFVVDEFQDVNPAQIEFLARLAPPAAARDIVVVGDDDQAIYAFRGASELAFEVFRKRWNPVSVIKLTENHRSRPRIIATANQIISGAIRRFDATKVIQSPEGARPEKGIVETVGLLSDLNDAELIPAMIIADRAERSDATWSEYAIIARSHTDLDRIAAGLEMRGIPFSRRHRVWWQEESVQDALSWITLLVEQEPAERLAAAQRLLRRPPSSVEPSTVLAWRQTFAAELARADLDADAPLTEREFLDWLVARHAVVPAVSTLHARLRELQKFAGEHNAEETIARIISLTGLAHSELLDPRERATRVRSLVRLLRVANLRQPRLDPPGDLHAFWAYGKDFSAKTGPLGEALDENVDPEANEGDSDREGIQLLTAHASKGLEFDTVFVPRVGGAHGYNTSRDRNGPILPPELLTDDNDTRSEQDRKSDENRRLFYVACTRAERRLVVLSKKNKTRSKGINFFEELVFDSQPDAISNLDEDAVRTQAARAATGADAVSANDGVLRAQLAIALESRSRTVDELRREARVLASNALDNAQQPSLSPVDLDRVASILRDSAGLLAIAETASRGEPPPPWSTTAAAPEIWRDALERLTSAKSRLTTSTGITLTPPKPPIQLSYTRVQDYLTCPRCWYLKHVLQLTTPGSTAQSVGLVVHRALERFYMQRREAESDGATPPTLDDLLRSAREMYLRGLGPQDAPDSHILRQVESQLQHVHSSLHRDTDDILELERLVRFEFVHNGIAHKFDAKIDRIDRLPDGGIRIIDYKTGRPAKAKTEPKPDDLQLGIYALAAAHLFETGETPPPGVAEYWVLASGERGSISLADLRLDKVRKKVGDAIDGMLAGDFGQGKDCPGDCSLLFPSGDSDPMD